MANFSKTDQVKLVTKLANQFVLKDPELDVIPQDSEDFPWFIREFQRILKAQQKKGTLLLPNLREYNDTVGIFTDYGGESPTSKYSTYSFLACAYNQTDLFSEAMTKTRIKYGLNEPYKEIAFKDYKYGPLRRALPEYLRHLSNLTNGLLLTVAIERDVGSLFGEDKKRAQRYLAQVFFDEKLGKWKPHIAEKLIITLHFIAYLVSLLSRPGSKVFWMTDHDAIVPSSEKHQIALKLFAQYLNHYCKHELAVVGGAVPFKERSMIFDDLLSAADVTAGAIEHFLTRYKMASEDPLITEQADEVLKWVAVDGIALKHQVMVIRRESGVITSSSLRFISQAGGVTEIAVPIFLQKAKL